MSRRSAAPAWKAQSRRSPRALRISPSTRSHGAAEAGAVGGTLALQVRVEDHRQVTQEEPPLRQHVHAPGLERAEALGGQRLERAPLLREVRAQVVAAEARAELVEVQV